MSGRWKARLDRWAEAARRLPVVDVWIIRIHREDRSGTPTDPDGS